MQTIIVEQNMTYGNPFFCQYNIGGWGNPAGEVYDLKSGHYLALLNTQSTGYRRKIFKSSKSACKWVENGLRSQFPNDELKYQIEI